MTADEPVLLSTDRGHVRTLTLNRPAVKNALNRDLSNQLSAAVAAAEADPEVWIIVLTGTGDTFCAGGDLKDMARADTGSESPRQVRPKVSPTRSIFELMMQLETPVIGALNGHAVAGGFELALACDLRIVAAEARLGLPEAKRGMGAAFGTVVLPRLIPPTLALELLFTGRYMDSAEAQRLGLVNQVVPSADVLPTAMALAETIAANAPLTVRRIKANALGTAGLPLSTALQLNLGPDPYASEDRIEGVRAFVEKRAPQWRNR